MSARLKYTLVVRHPDTLTAVPLVKGSEVPDWASDLVHDDDLEGGKSEKKSKKAKSAKSEKKSDKSSDGGYRGTNAELQAEIDKRNEDRAEDDKIVVGGNGNKADLIAALEADDAK